MYAFYCNCLLHLSSSLYIYRFLLHLRAHQQNHLPLWEQRIRLPLSSTQWSWYSCIIIVVRFCLFLWFYCQPTILFLLPELKINGPIYENRLLLHNAFAKMVISESFSSSLQVRFMLDLMTCLWTCKDLVILKFLAFNISVHSQSKWI